MNIPKYLKIPLKYLNSTILGLTILGAAAVTGLMNGDKIYEIYPFKMNMGKSFQNNNILKLFNEKKFNKHFKKDIPKPYSQIYLPNLPEHLEDADLKTGITIFDRNGEEVFNSKLKKNITYDECPTQAIDSILTTEDKNFEKHRGIDLTSLLRISYDFPKFIYHKLTKKGGNLPGGSTLDQQVAKILFMYKDDNILIRKAKQMITAVELNAKYTKKEIFESYINNVDLGFYRGINIRGLSAGANIYFGKELNKCNLNEFIWLAATINSPSIYDDIPRYTKEISISDLKNLKREFINKFKHKKIERIKYASLIKAINRPEIIAKQMYNIKHITEDELNETLNQKLKFTDSNDYVIIQHAPYFVDLVKKELVKKYGEKSLDVGLKVYTTLDLKLNEMVESEVKKYFDNNVSLLKKEIRLKRRNEKKYKKLFFDPKQPNEWKKRLENDFTANPGIVIMDPKTFEILTLVGGRDFKKSDRNRAINKVGSPGSTFKPIIYGIAFESGKYNPQTLVYDGDFSFKFDKRQPPWEPKDFNNESANRPITIEEALINSVNIVAARVGTKFDLEETINVIKEMGDIDKISEHYSIILGEVHERVSPLEMARIYSTISNNGLKKKEQYINKITDVNDNLLEEQEQEEFNKQILSPNTWYQIKDIMEKVVRFGTGKKANLGEDYHILGKTGTSNGNKDSWFCSIVNNPKNEKYVMATWVGFDQDISIGTSTQYAVPLSREILRHIAKPEHEKKEEVHYARMKFRSPKVKKMSQKK